MKKDHNNIECQKIIMTDKKRLSSYAVNGGQQSEIADPKTLNRYSEQPYGHFIKVWGRPKPRNIKTIEP